MDECVRYKTNAREPKSRGLSCASPCKLACGKVSRMSVEESRLFLELFQVGLNQLLIVCMFYATHIMQPILGDLMIENSLHNPHVSVMI